MTTAENIQILHEGGYKAQALRMAEAESVSIDLDAQDEPEAYIFADGSKLLAPEMTVIDAA